MELLPVTNDPSSVFETTIEGQNVRFTVRWNSVQGVWYTDIFGVSFDLDLKGLALVPGENIIGPYAVTELGSIVVFDSEGKNANPDFDGFGDRYQVAYITKDELA